MTDQRTPKGSRMLGTNLATVAAELGYTDHAHLANEFRSVLGLTLSTYRRDVSVS